MMKPENPTELASTLTFAQFDSIVRGIEPLPDNVAPEMLDLIIECIELAGDEGQCGLQASP